MDEAHFYQFDDSPAVRADMRGQIQRLRASEASVMAFAVRAEHLSSALSSIGLDKGPVEQLLSPEELATLAVGETLTQLGDFAENMQHQLQKNVVQPLKVYHDSIGVALKAARAFDEESDALDALHLKYLALSKDSPIETRAHAHADLCDRAAGVALKLLDARTLLNEACASQRVVPQRALSELLVAQLAYHQSCSRLLTALMPSVSGTLAQADDAQARVESDKAAAAQVRSAMPQPQTRESESTVLEGWLYKGAFNLTTDGGADTSMTGALSARLKPWAKRWFVLSDDGTGHAKLYYYKAPEDAKVAKVPIDMNLLSAVHAVNGPLELELRIGQRMLRLKAADTADRDRWMLALTTYVQTHQDEHKAAVARNQRRYRQAHGALGVRDLDGGRGGAGHSRNTREGWLYRQDVDMMRRWRKWWCVVGTDGALSCTLYESLRVAEADQAARHQATHGKAKDKAVGSTKSAAVGAPGSAAPAAGGGASGGGASDGGGDRDEAGAADAGLGLDARLEVIMPPPLPCRVSQTTALPLATVSVREGRQFSVPYVFEVISPQQTVALQAQSQEEMAQWIQTIQNATAMSLGCAVRTPRMSSVSAQSSVWGRIRKTEGNDRCADCGASNPAWASINLGVVICLNCSGVHRQMGVHISKVRSLELDTKEWSVPLLSLMTNLGNAALGDVWHAPPADAAAAAGSAVAVSAGARTARPPADATNAVREAYIRQKYEARALLDAAAKPPQPSLHLAALHDDAPLAAACLIHGCGVDEPAPAEAMGEWSSVAAAEHKGRTPLHIAAAVGAETVLELLLQNLAASSEGVDGSDSLGRSALTFAVDAGHAGCVEQLITRGANISHCDHAQQTPMAVAAARGLDAIVATMLEYKLAQDEKLLRQIDVGDE